VNAKVRYEVQEHPVTVEESEEWGIIRGQPSATFLVLVVVCRGMFLQQKKIAVFKSGADALTFEKWINEQRDIEKIIEENTI